jgi:hypothetical protein
MERSSNRGYCVKDGQGWGCSEIWKAKIKWTQGSVYNGRSGGFFQPNSRKYAIFQVRTKLLGFFAQCQSMSVRTNQQGKETGTVERWTVGFRYTQT